MEYSTTVRDCTMEYSTTVQRVHQKHFVSQRVQADDHKQTTAGGSGQTVWQKPAQEPLVQRHTADVGRLTIADGQAELSFQLALCLRCTARPSSKRASTLLLSITGSGRYAEGSAA